MSRISAIEFGVAGGNGLVELERIATEVSAVYGVEIDVFGFDTGVGLPKPEDYRDFPNLYRACGFRMDEPKLRGLLKRARLILGDVADTIETFMASGPAPVGFVSIDVDLYSSTMAAFKLFTGDPRLLLPRVYCYFDDILGETFSEFTGERLAVAEFNAAHSMRKISPIFGLRYHLREPHQMEPWPDQMFIAHLFDHELYVRYAGTSKFNAGTFESAITLDSLVRRTPFPRRNGWRRRCSSYSNERPTEPPMPGVSARGWAGESCLDACWALGRCNRPADLPVVLSRVDC